jgi:hypothetical protein
MKSILDKFLQVLLKSTEKKNQTQNSKAFLILLTAYSNSNICFDVFGRDNLSLRYLGKLNGKSNLKYLYASKYHFKSNLAIMYMWSTSASTGSGPKTLGSNVNI